MSNRSRNYCYTINNYTGFQESTARAMVEGIKYHVFGIEVGDSGTPHMQGFICFKHTKSYAAVKKLFHSNGIHLERKKGTFKQASEYCKKEGSENVHEYGTLPMDQKEKGEKEKEKWMKVRKMAESGDFENLREQYPKISTLHYKLFKIIRRDYQIRPESLECHDNWWIWGPPGTGKSYAARALGDYYLKPLNKWWDGYKGETNVIIEEVDASHGKWLAHFIKKWSDIYAFKAEMKFGGSIIRPKRIIVCCNYSIDVVFDGVDYICQKAIKERFHEVHYGKVLGKRRKTSEILFMDTQ